MPMSGYPDGEMPFLNRGWRFIEKPFLPAELVKRRDLHCEAALVNP